MSRIESLVEAIDKALGDNWDFDEKRQYKTAMRDGHGGHARHIRHMMENANKFVDNMLDPYNEYPNPKDQESEQKLLEVKCHLNEACQKIREVKETKKRGY